MAAKPPSRTPSAAPSKIKIKNKAAAKAAKQERRAVSKQRRAQFIQAFKIQRREDKALLPLLIGAFLIVTAVGVGLGFLFDQLWFSLPMGIVTGLLVAIMIFGRRVQRNVFVKAEGQPGAAAWVLDNLRGRWKVTPAVAGTGQLDAVHRVIGRPGVVLVAEGAAHRLKPLLAQEKKRISRLIGETPIYDVTVGNREGEVPLAKLARHLAKLPRNINAAQIDGLEGKLAILSTRGAAMPKGPVPQGAKMRNLQRAVRRR
jgi:F0F1-type ATP synthase assembly protein I